MSGPLTRPGETHGASPVALIQTPGAGGAASPLTTKGDIYTYDSADERLPVGADGQMIIADSTEPTGLKWGGGGEYHLPFFALSMPVAIV